MMQTDKIFHIFEMIIYAFRVTNFDVRSTCVSVKVSSCPFSGAVDIYLRCKV